MSNVSTRRDMRCTTTVPIISGHTHDTGHTYIKSATDEILHDPLHERKMNSLEANEGYKNESTVIQKMQKRLIFLWNAKTRYQNLRILRPNQSFFLELWKHLQYCQDKSCRRKKCQSSCLLIDHFNRCKKLNQSLTCEVCAPVIKHIIEKSRDDKQLIKKRHGVIEIEKKKLMDRISFIKLYSNQQSMMYTCPGNIRNAQSKAMCVKHSTHYQKPWCTEIDCNKTVKGGKEYALVQVVQTSNANNHFLYLQNVQQYENKQHFKKKDSTNALSSNVVRPFEMHPHKTSLSGIVPTLARTCILEGENKEVFDASIALLRLKNRKNAEIGPGHKFLRHRLL